jgi:hypothetical protein
LIYFLFLGGSLSCVECDSRTDPNCISSPGQFRQLLIHLSPTVSGSPGRFRKLLIHLSSTISAHQDSQATAHPSVLKCIGSSGQFRQLHSAVSTASAHQVSLGNCTLSFPTESADKVIPGNCTPAAPTVSVRATAYTSVLNCFSSPGQFRQLLIHLSSAVSDHQVSSGHCIAPTPIVSDQFRHQLIVHNTVHPQKMICHFTQLSSSFR